MFGGIGTLVETSQLQYNSYNDAFLALDIDYHWDFTSYVNSLSSNGGVNRLSMIRLNDGRGLTPSQIRKAHELKSRLYVDQLSKAKLPLRAGVATLIEDATADGIQLAWATTTSRANIDAVIASTNGAINAAMFAFIGNETLVSLQKPDPQIYQLCLKALGHEPTQVMAIEDSVMGVQAAKAAGLFTIGFPGEFNVSKSFEAADVRLSDLASALTVVR
jgi:HAD superfamily hydrolase (TIGR01509 family)